MEELQTLDNAAFARVWRRVMPADRPDCPFIVDAPPPSPPVCLGEDSVGDLPALRALLCRTVDGRRVYRALARRRQGEKLLPALFREKERQARRLRAADFLISGEDFMPPPTPAPPAAPLAQLLRGRYQEEGRLALDFFTAAQTAADPCLRDLYRTLGAECQTVAGKLRSWLEQRDWT